MYKKEDFAEVFIDLKMILLNHRNNYVRHSSCLCSKFSAKLFYIYFRIFIFVEKYEKKNLFRSFIHFFLGVTSTFDTFNTDDVSQTLKIRVQRLHLIMKSDLQNSRFVSAR